MNLEYTARVFRGGRNGIVVRPRLSAFTLVELLVVVTIVGVLVALLLPAVQGARETARRLQCSNNLKQLALAFHSYDNVWGGFPAARFVLGTSANTGSGWGVRMLPFVEQEPLYSRFDFSKSFFDAENGAVVSTPLSVFTCPSVPTSPRLIALTIGGGGKSSGTQGALGDYFVNHLLNSMYQVKGAAGHPALETQNDVSPIARISDGTSNTILIHECAGRPNYYIFGQQQATTTGLTNPVWWGAWASYQHFTYQSYNANGTAAGWACAINCNNSQGTYSFHTDGANLAFCDGGVRFISTSVDTHLFFALLTRDGGEAVPDNY